MAAKFNLKRQPGFASIAVICIVALYLPVLLLVAYSFNSGTSIAIWEGFSWRWYASAWQNEKVQDATLRSLLIATCASALSTTAATMAALATTRGKPLKGHGIIYAIINQPLMIPQIVTAVSLLIFFAMIKVATGYGGILYLIAAHTAFCIPFAYMPIRARLQTMDETLEQAASDLYAPPFLTFRRVTLPLLRPGILAGAMLAFVVSLDDVVITEFVKSAGQDTLPTYMLGQLRRIITPEINAVSTVLLALSVSLLIGFFIISSRNTESRED